MPSLTPWALGTCPSAAQCSGPAYTLEAREKGEAQPRHPAPPGVPAPTSEAGLHSAEFCWGAGSRDRKVPSSDTWDFSVSFSMPGRWGGEP